MAGANEAALNMLREIGRPERIPNISPAPRTRTTRSG
jgi:citrate synthase